MAKANKDGWIRHRGGKCPVEKGTRVDVRYRNGGVSINQPALEKGSPTETWAETWEHNGTIADIMAYRLHTPATQQEPKPMTAEEIRAQYMENLSSISMLHTKNAALVDELRKLGFDFYETPAAAQQEDMSDPKNWRVGDLVKIKNRTTLHSFSIGQTVKLKSRIDADGAGNEWEIDSPHPARYIAPRDAEFHSRPPK